MLGILNDYDQDLKAFLKLFEKSETLKMNQITRKYNKKDAVIYLSILIQLRIIKYEYRKNTYLYKLNREMIIRRLFYPFYLNYVIRNFDEETLDKFKLLLQIGICEITNYSPNQLFRYEKKSDIVITRNSYEQEEKRLKVNRYLIIDFAYLDSLIFKEYCYSFLSMKYSTKMVEYFRILERTEIKNQIDDSNFKYLVNEGILQKNENFYIIDYEEFRNLLVKNQISRLLKNKRLFNLIYRSKINDIEFIKQSLLPKSELKSILIDQMKDGIINMSLVNRNNIIWEIDIEKTINIIQSRILRDINLFMTINSSEERIPKVLELTKQLFIFSYKRKL